MTIRDILWRCDNDNMIIFIISSSDTITRSIYSLSDQELSLHFDRYEFGIYFDQMSITFKTFE